MFIDTFKRLVQQFGGKRKRDGESIQGMEIDSQPAFKRSSSIHINEDKEQQPAVVSGDFATPTSKTGMKTALPLIKAHQWQNFSPSSHSVPGTSGRSRRSPSHTQAQAGRSPKEMSPLSRFLPTSTTPRQNYRTYAPPETNSQSFIDLTEEEEGAQPTTSGPSQWQGLAPTAGTRGPPMPLVAAAHERARDTQPQFSERTWAYSAMDIIGQTSTEIRGLDNPNFQPAIPLVDPTVLNAVLATQKYNARAKDTNAAIRKAQTIVQQGKRNEEQSRAKESEAEALGRSIADLHIEKRRAPQLEPEDYDEYDRLTTQPQSTKLITHPLSNIDIKGHDMSTLAPANWLNDEVINLSMSLLQERDARRRQKKQGPTCHFFSSFFLNALYKDQGTYNYDKVKRWTLPARLKRAGQTSTSILDCDRIIMPCNQGNTHWVCAMIDLKNRKFVMYDSMQGEDKTCLQYLAQYLKDEYKAKRDEVRDDILEWPREFPKNIPRQANGYDCGMFTVLFADYAGQGATFDFGQEDIQNFRVRAVRDIMRLQIE